MHLKAALPVLCLILTGCAGVIPLAKETHTPQGTRENMHLDFLRLGQTTRAEVHDKLKPFDTGVKSHRFFVGRWTSSGWAWFAMGSTSGSGGRHWSTTNLLIELDDRGLVKRFESFSDKDLIRELGPVVDDYKPAETTGRTELAVKSVASPSATIVLRDGSLEFDGVGPRKRPSHFTIPATKVSSIGSMMMQEADPIYTSQAIHFSEALEPLGGPRGNRIYVRITVPDLVTLLNYVRANVPHSSDNPR